MRLLVGEIKSKNEGVGVIRASLFMRLKWAEMCRQKIPIEYIFLHSNHGHTADVVG